MRNEEEFTRRLILAGAGAVAVAPWARADDAIPVYDPAKPTAGVAIPSAEKTREMAAAPRIKKTVTKVFNVSPAIKPNGMAFTPTGTLLLVTQAKDDEGKVFEVDAKTGKILRS